MGRVLDDMRICSHLQLLQKQKGENETDIDDKKTDSSSGGVGDFMDIPTKVVDIMTNKKLL